MNQQYFCNLTKKLYNDASENYPITQNQSLSQASPNILKNTSPVILTIAFLAITHFCLGQNANDFRSTANGNWNKFGSWQRFNGTIWKNAISGETPGSNSSVTVLNTHFITLTASATATNLTINTGGAVTFSAGFRLDITNNLIINGNLTVPLSAQLKVNVDSHLGQSKCLLLQSDDVETGSLISGTFSGSGTINIKRYMSISDRWHLFSSPFSDQTVHDFIKTNDQIPDLYNTDTEKLIGVGMRDYDTNLDVWNDYLYYENENPLQPPGNMVVGKGYSIRTYNVDGEDTGFIYSTGIPDKDNNISIGLNVSGSRWNCIGNPFTSGLSVSNFLLANSSLIDNSYNALYVWVSKDSTYIPFNLSGSSNLQIGQGFFVKSKLAGGNISFTPGMQVFEPSETFKSATTAWPSIILIADNQTLKSSADIKFVNNSTKGLDPGYDAGIFKTNPDFALYSKLLTDNSEDFALQCLPDKNYDQYVIPIGIDCKVAGDITFSAATVNLPSGCLALLEDRLTNRFTRLDLYNAKYTAYVSADTKGTGRFFLHTSDVIGSDQSQEKQPFKVSVIDKTVYINGEVSNQAKIFIYSVNGKQLANFSAESQAKNQFNASGFPTGIYILTINDKFQKKSIKFVIEN